MSKLSERMTNKKYFHKYNADFLRMQKSKNTGRTSIMGKAGELDESAFDFINSQKEFNDAINSSLKPFNSVRRAKDARSNISIYKNRRKQNYSTDYSNMFKFVAQQ